MNSAYIYWKEQKEAKKDDATKKEMSIDNSNFEHTWIVIQVKNGKTINKWAINGDLNYLKDGGISFPSKSGDIILKKDFYILLVRDKSWSHANIKEMMEPLLK